MECLLYLPGLLRSRRIGTVFLLFGVLATWRGMLRHLINKRTWAKTERIQETDIPAAIPVGAPPSLSRTASEG